MRKIITLALAAFVCIGANAQFMQTMKKLDIFNHVGVGVGIGTTGITVDLGTTITPWVQLRAGADIMPQFKINTSLDLEEYEATTSAYNRPVVDEIDVQGKLTNTTGHILFDIFPITHLSSFHVTVGGYFRGPKIISAYNTSGQQELMDVYDYNHREGQYTNVPWSDGRIGAVLGDYFIEPDKNGNLEASIRVWKFRPYVGIGFGRMVPKSRINCLFDLGVQFWGSPQVWNDTSNQQLLDQGMKGEDGGIIKTISKISIYPVLSVKLVGRIF